MYKYIQNGKMSDFYARIESQDTMASLQFTYVLRTDNYAGKKSPETERERESFVKVHGEITCAYIVLSFVFGNQTMRALETYNGKTTTRQRRMR